jgi:hypothetical protein
LIQLNEIHHSSSVEIIAQRFDWIGGIPRHTFSSIFEFVEVDLKNALLEKGGDIVDHFFLHGFEFEMRALYLLIHLHPDPDPQQCYSVPYLCFNFHL